MPSVLPLRFGLALAAPPPDIPGPDNTVAPVVTGTLNDGDTLTCTTGTWTGDGSITYAYQWCYALLDDSDAVLTDEDGNPIGVAIGGATSSTYVISATYVGGYIFCIVTATDDNGSTSADSNVVGPIT